MINVKKIWQRVIPAIVIILLIVVFFIIFMVDNNNRVVLQNGNYVSDAVDQTASNISENLYTAVRTLNNISEICAPEDDNSYPEDLKRVDNSIFSMIDYVAYEHTDDEGYHYGTLYGFRETHAAPGGNPDFIVSVTSNPGTNGSGVDGYAYVNGFALGMDLQPGEAGMREEFSSLSSVDSNMMSFYTALYAEDGSRLGVLIGRYDESKMRDILKTTFFGENSGVYLCTAEGTIITTTDENLYTYINGGNLTNILEVLQRVETNRNFDEISKSFLSGDKLSFNFTVSNGTVNACFMQLPLHEGVSADNWIILQTFPAAITSRMQALANLEGLQLGLELFFALALYVGIIIILNYIQNKKLVKENQEMTYVINGLSTLYDRFIYVNLNEKKYRYIADTYPDGCEIPAEGDYESFKNAITATFADDYDKELFSVKLEIPEIKSEMSEGTSELRFEYRAGGDEMKWEDLSLICLSREDGEAKEVLFARQNISELKEKELHNQLVLKQAFRAAEDANHAKSDFLSRMSHDIRTPMNAVLGFSALLDNSADNPEKVKEYSKKIQVAGNHLLGLINEILDMSKIESGKFTITVSEFKMSELIDGVSSAIQTQANAKNQTYTVHSNLIGDNYLGDKLRISQILINILSNAVKYTPDGGAIEFDISSGDKFSDNIYNVVFTVKDNGIGMSEEFLKRLYTPFEREVNTMTGKTQGTGLGMAITKNLVDLMGGTIDVQSVQGEGTTFTVTLQLRVTESTSAPAPVVAAVTDGGNPLKGMSFLVVEDNTINAEILCELLEIAGAKYKHAENGSIALDTFEHSKPGEFDMILMDIHMPVMDGYAAAAAIRASAHPNAKTIPIAAMTANTFAEDIRHALESGMNAHIAKPVSLDVLKSTVKQLTEKK